MAPASRADAVHSHAASPGARTSDEAGAGGPDTASHVPAADRESRGEGRRWGWRPQSRDLWEQCRQTCHSRDCAGQQAWWTGTDLLLEPYRVHHLAGSWARGGTADEQDSPGRRASARVAAVDSDRSLVEECWRTKYWRIAPQVAACTARGGPQVAGCKGDEHWQQQNLRPNVQKGCGGCDRRAVLDANLTVRTRGRAGCP